MTDESLIQKALDDFILTLPIPAQKNICESMRRGESITADAFKAGYRATTSQQLTERNFCETCGKRLHAETIHTCSPPREQVELSDASIEEICQQYRLCDRVVRGILGAAKGKS